MGKRIEDYAFIGNRNDVGLLAEEYEPVEGRLLGNFPPAYSHIALINTANNLASVSGPAKQRAAIKQDMARTMADQWVYRTAL